MDYEEFCELLGSKMDKPSSDFLQNDDGIHVTIHVGKWDEGGIVPYSSIPGEVLIDAKYIAEERGAVRGKDYIVTCGYNDKDYIIEVTLHTTHTFLSDEDFDPSIKRKWTNDRQ